MTAVVLGIGVHLCECGCGQPTALAPQTRTSRGWVKGQPMRFIAGHNPRGRTRALCGRWRGGRADVGGYVGIYQPEHPRASNGYVLEHILVAEKALGRALDAQHPVHHVDESRANNANSNLVVCQDAAYHKLLHRRARALAECGNASARRCVICHQYDRQENITVTTGGRAYHRTCAAAATRTPMTEAAS